MSLDGHSIQVQLWGFNPTPGVLGDPGVGPVPAGGSGEGPVPAGRSGEGPVAAGGSGGGAYVCWGIWGWDLCLH